MYAAAVGLAQHHRQLRDLGAGERVQQRPRRGGSRPPPPAWSRAGSRACPPAPTSGRPKGLQRAHELGRLLGRRRRRSRRPGTGAGWRSRRPGRPSMRASAVTMFRAQRARDLEQAAAVHERLRSRRARRIPCARLPGTTAAGSAGPGRRAPPAAAPSPASGRCGEQSRRVWRRVDVVLGHELADAVSRVHARARRARRVDTSSPVTSSTTPGPVRNMPRSLGHDHEVGEGGRVGAAARRDAGDRRRSAARGPRAPRSRGRCARSRPARPGPRPPARRPTRRSPPPARRRGRPGA